MHMTKVLLTIPTRDMVNRAAILLLVAFLGACSSAPKQYTIRGEGDPILNRDIGGKSLSVVVRIYQLKDAREFSKLTFDTLASGRSETELLGPALLDKTDVIVVPGGDYTSSEKLLDETKHIGIVAFFRNPDPYYWRQLVDVDAIGKQGMTFNRNKLLTFRVQDCYVMLTGAKPTALPGQPLNARPECGTSNFTGAPPNTRPASMVNQPAARQATSPPNRTRTTGSVLQTLPDVNVGVNTPIAPANVQIGGGGIGAINIGNAPPPAGQPPAPTNYNTPR